MSRSAEFKLYEGRNNNAENTDNTNTAPLVIKGRPVHVLVKAIRFLRSIPEYKDIWLRIVAKDIDKDFGEGDHE